jgi:hypothetical protein
VNRNDGNTIYDGFVDIENGKRCSDAGEKGSFGEIHSGTDATSVPKAYIAWVTLSILAWRGNVALWLKLEWVVVRLGVM